MGSLLPRLGFFQLTPDFQHTTWGAIAFFALALTAATPVFSEETLSRTVRADGRITEISVPPGASEESITFSFRSKGNMTQLADLLVQAPDGAIVTAKAARKSGSSSFTKSYPLLFLDGGKERKLLKLKGKEVPVPTPSPTPASEGNVSAPSESPTAAPTETPTPSPTPSRCSEFPDKEYEAWRKFSRFILGHELSYDEICELFTAAKYGTKESIVFKGTFSDEAPIPASDTYISKGTKANIFKNVPTSGPSATTELLIRKDTCGQSPKSEYQVELEINLSKVSSATKAQGFNIKVGVEAKDYKGDRASSVKPVSDGKYAPQPLFLMSAIGGQQHQVSLVQWSGNKPRSIRSRKAADFVGWRSHFLTRTPAGGLLTGGKATVELSNGSEAYSICFDLSARRQTAAGYGK